MFLEEPNTLNYKYENNNKRLKPDITLNVYTLKS